MEFSLGSLSKQLHLGRSEVYGYAYNQYSQNLQVNHVHSYNELTVSNLDEWHSSILMSYPFLNDLQLCNLKCFVENLAGVLNTLNPDKLKNIRVDFIDAERELMFWKESVKGIKKISFDVYGQITYVSNGNDGSKKRGVFEAGVDMEKLIYRFLSL